ncbi:MAG: hypothetical protein QM741_01015 [Rudaea sp.]|uniref:hypothetical protein n=1 Tax=Rudaea sp. TaxID=2136325 RepID=UPI0039E2DE2D
MATGFGLAAAMPAHAVFLDPNGRGQVLVYPYFTVNGNNTTLVTLINSSKDAKAVKVRFLEGYDGRDVLDFNLYLAPLDTWVGAVVEKGEGAALFTNDGSCTVPALPSTLEQALAFSTANFNAGSAQGADGGPTGLARTREGHIEVIEMGTVTDAAHGTRTSIQIDADGKRDCTQVVDAWADAGYWRSDAQVDIGPPSGGLFGSGTIVDVALGSVASYNADAVAQFYADGDSGEHSAPDALTPNIAGGTSLTALVYANDKPFDLTFSQSIDAVSAVFMADTLANEYWTGGGTAASSEWVITYPTRCFYVDPYYVGQQARMPFENIYAQTASGDVVSYTDLQWVQVDREGYGDVFGTCLEPLLCPPPRLLYDSQVVTFGISNPDGIETDEFYNPKTPSGILGSNLVPMNLPASAAGTGWARLDFRQGKYIYSQPRLLATTDGRALAGQPVTGFWVAQLVNGNVDGNGVLANYTSLFRHKSTSTCTKVADGSACS